MSRILLVGCGGFLGSVSRYLVSGWAQNFFDTNFPVGTLIVNLTGSTLLGLLLALSLERGWIGPEWRLFLTVGFCGGFTTMSAFGYETFYLLREGSVLWAVGNISANFAGAVMGAWLGDLVGRVV